MPPRRTPTWTRRAIWALAVADVAGFLVQGSNRPARPHLVPTVIGAPAAKAVRLTVTSGPGRPAEPTHCFLLASTPDSRARGLMGRHDLGGYAGMVFTYPTPSTDSYVMRDVALPLSIAFFDRAGAFVSTAAMLPCPSTEASCPRYAPAGPFELAVEAPRGGLTPLGVGPGATVHLGGPCAP